VKRKVKSATEPGKGKMGGSCGSGSRVSCCGRLVAGETTLNSLITGVIPGEIVLSDSRATMRISLIMTNLTGLVQSTVVCTYSWYLLHLVTVLILKSFFFVPLFLLSCSAFLPLTSFLSGCERVIDL